MRLYRTEQLSLRLSPEELVMLQWVEAAVGHPRAVWIRRLILDEAHKLLKRSGYSDPLGSAREVVQGRVQAMVMTNERGITQSIEENGDKGELGEEE